MERNRKVYVRKRKRRKNKRNRNWMRYIEEEVLYK